MKRFLSLVLVSVMLLSTLMLTSCDFLNKTKDFAHGIFGIEDDKDQDARTTITYEEWVSVNEITNFTFTINEGNGYGATILASDNAAKVEVNFGTYLTQNIIIDFDNSCMIKESGIGYLGYITSELLDFEKLKLSDIAQFEKEDFEKLKYDAENKCHYIDEYGIRASFYFEDGKFVAMIMCIVEEDGDSFEYATIKNIGTTVVELPEYTIVNDGKIDPSKADPSVRTTITDEDLINFFSNPNFTVSTEISEEFDVIGGDTAELTLKVAENSLKLTASQFGESESQYMTIVDGVLYSIERHGDGYLATSISDIESILAELGPVEDVSIVDYLVYDEVGRYYTLDIEGLKFYLFFEEGQLVKAVYVMENAYSNDYVEYLEIIFVISDIGTTVVEIPEYVINAE